MPMQFDLTKLTAPHLSRSAKIYPRQSSKRQVEAHPISGQRQRNLALLAHELGWAAEQIEVITADQGRSSTLGAQPRAGFEQMLAAVSLGEVGAVFCLEAPRLARTSSSWARLFELCLWTDTLIVDGDNIYDLNRPDDQMIMGIKALMSSHEHLLILNRTKGAREVKATDGELRMPPPAGFMYGPDNHLIYDSDPQVVAAIQRVFELFDGLGSARAVTKYLQEQGLQLPCRRGKGLQQRPVQWHRANISRVRAILHNPRYAGVYVYGQSKTQRRVVEGLPAKRRHISDNPADWSVVIQAHHPAYISWGKFLENRQRLRGNRTVSSWTQRGVVRDGPTLLQGAVHCGSCHRHMRIMYAGKKPAHAYYVCTAGNTLEPCAGDRPIRSTLVDQAVSEVVLAQFQPTQLEEALIAANELDSQQQQEEQLRQAQRAYATAAAAEVKRRLDAIDPSYTLAYRDMTRLWNERLEQCEELRRQIARAPAPSPALQDAERQQILQLAQDLPAIWHATTTTPADRKQLLRYLIKEVTLRRQGPMIHVTIRWATEAWTQLVVAQPGPGQSAEGRTPTAVIDRIRELACTHHDAAVAACLNQEGFVPLRRSAFKRATVRALRTRAGIPPYQPAPETDAETRPPADHYYSVRKAAQLLQVSPVTIRRWCRAERVTVRRPEGSRHWQVYLPPDQLGQRPPSCHPAIKLQARIQELAENYTDAEIATQLTAEGLHRVNGTALTRSYVAYVRRKGGIPAYETRRKQEPQAEGRVSAAVAATLLHTTSHRVAHRCRIGQLDGIQRAAGRPWWIRLTPAQIAEHDNQRDPAQTRRIILQRIGDLVLTCTDREIAARLQQEGVTTANGRPMTADRVLYYRQTICLPSPRGRRATSIMRGRTRRKCAQPPPAPAGTSARNTAAEAAP